MYDFVELVRQFPVYIVVLIRTLGLLGTVPLFSRSSVPLRVKISISCLVSLVILPAIPETAFHGFALPDTLLGWIFLIAKEMTVGVLLGLIAAMVTAGVMSAGELISRNMGLAVAAEFDPETRASTTPLTRLYLVIFSLFLLVLNVHHWFLELLVRTYDVVPLGGLSLNPGLGMRLVEMTAWIYIIGVKVGAPVLAILFLTTVAIGIMALAAPQVNILMISFPIRMAIGLIALGLSLSVFGRNLEDIVLKMQAEMESMLYFMT